MHQREKENQFYNKLSLLLKGELPSEKAHHLLSPPNRPLPIWNEVAKFNPKKSAVAVIIHQEHILFIQRAKGNNVHAGQISFPGGKAEYLDKNSIYTAIRESKEEVNIELQENDYLGSLTPIYIPPSNFWVEPHVFACNSLANCKPQLSEVDAIFKLSIDLLQQTTPTIKEINTLKSPIQVPGYSINNAFIWGATAMILTELLFLLKE